MEQPAACTAAHSACDHPAHLLPDELWALVLSKCSWREAWRQVRPLLLWRPDAGKAMHSRPELLVQLLSAHPRSSSESLLLAARKGRGAVVEALLAREAAPPPATVLTTMLERAAESGHLDIAQLALAAGRVHGDSWRQSASVSALSCTCAVYRGSTAVAAVLLDASNGRMGEDAMAEAAFFDHVDMLQLLQRGANDPSFADHMRRALLSAVFHERPRAVRLLLAAGAACATPAASLQHAARNGMEEVVQLQLQHGYAALYGARTPGEDAQLLQEVVAKGHVGTARLLVANGTPFTRAAARRLGALLQAAV